MMDSLFNTTVQKVKKDVNTRIGDAIQKHLKDYNGGVVDYGRFEIICRNLENRDGYEVYIRDSSDNTTTLIERITFSELIRIES